jgi:transposase-like protein
LGFDFRFFTGSDRWLGHGCSPFEDFSIGKTSEIGNLCTNAVKTRKQHSGEFKAKVALEANKGLKTVNEMGQEFGVHPSQVGLWKKELLERAAGLFEIKRGPKPLDDAASPERLYGEIGRLKRELDWLKKKSGISL